MVLNYNPIVNSVCLSLKNASKMPQDKYLYYNDYINNIYY